MNFLLRGMLLTLAACTFDRTNFSLPIVNILTIRDGLIAKDTTYYDL